MKVPRQPEADRESIAAWVSVILDERSSPGELHQAVNGMADQLFTWAGLVVGSVTPGPDSNETVLDCGIAISPVDAAMCLRDLARTTAFLRGVDRAIGQLLETGQGEPVRILYAGCGPFAPLVVPLLHRYRAGEVEVRLLDIHGRSLELCRSLVERLGVADRIVGYVEADAAVYRVDGSLPHLVITETMQAALEKEGQVAIAANLGGQLEPEGILIPEAVRLTAVLLDPRDEFSVEMRREERRVALGTVLELTRDSAGSIVRASEEFRPLTCLDLPASRRPGLEPWVLTEIEVHDGIGIRPHESGLTIPRPILLDRPLEVGERLCCHYRSGPSPGLVFRIASPAAGTFPSDSEGCARVRGSVRE